MTRALESLKNLLFNGLLLTKLHNVWAKKVQKSYLSWQWRMMQNLKRNWLVSSKLTWGITNFDEHLKISNICPLMGCLWPKYIMFELTKYIGVMFDGIEDWCKIWRKTDLYFQKWHEKFSKFSPEYCKVSKLGLWWDPLTQSRKCMSLKFTEGLHVMIMKNDAKFKEVLTCQFKIENRNLTNFDPSTRKSQTFAL